MVLAQGGRLPLVGEDGDCVDVLDASLSATRVIVHLFDGEVWTARTFWRCSSAVSTGAARANGPAGPGLSGGTPEGLSVEALQAALRHARTAYAPGVDAAHCPEPAPRRLLIAVTCCVTLLAGTVLATLLADGGGLAGEGAIVTVLQTGKGTRRALETLTQLGSGALLYALLAALAGLALRRGMPWRGALLPIAALTAAQALEAIIFATLTRPSPIADTSDISFSSGHAMTAVLGWGLVARQIGGPLWLLSAGLFAFVGGLSRVALGVHWPTDVVAGWLFGLCALILVELAQRRTPMPPLSPRVLRCSGSPWAWAVTAVAALVSLVPLLLVDGPQRMKDLLVYVGAGSVAGSGADVYEFRTVFDMPFTYPPFAAVLSEPLSRVPLGVLHLLWVLATLAALVAVARIAMRPVVARIGLPLTLALLLVSSPVRSHLRFGQVGLFLVVLVAADLLRDRRRTGVGLGLAVAIKLTPAVFLPWLLVRRQTTALVTAVGTAAVATLTGLVLLWPSAQEYLWRALWDSDRFGPNDVAGNQSVRGMLLRTGMDDRAATLLWLLSAAVLAVAATLGAKRLEDAGQRLGALGVLAALSIAVSPISWVHHLVFLVLPIAALVGAGRALLAAAWTLALIVSLPTLGTAGLRAGGPDALWQLVVNGQGLTAVAACVLLPRLLARSSASRPEAHTAAVA